MVSTIKNRIKTKSNQQLYPGTSGMFILTEQKDIKKECDNKSADQFHLNANMCKNYGSAGNNL